MADFDFTVTGINGILHRKATANWHANNLYNPNEFIMVAALDGEAFYTVEGKTISVKKSDVLIFTPKTERSGRADREKPWEFITVNFNFEMNEKTKDFFNKKYLHFSGIGERVLTKFTEIAYAWEGKKPLHHLKCKNLVASILYDIISSQLPHKKMPHMIKLESARTLMQENFRQEIVIEDIAEKIGLSNSYFRKLFKEAYGFSPMQYITDLRISTACDLLRSGEVNITEASILSGFNDIYYFSTLFKKQTGMSPSQYIKSNIKM